MSVTGPPGIGPVAGRHRDLRHRRRHAPHAGRARRAARARPHRARAVGAHLAARVDGQLHGLPGHALADRRRGAGPGGQPAPDHGADGRVPDRRRPPQRRRPWATSPAFCALVDAPEIADDPRFADFASRRRAPRRARRRPRRARSAPAPRPSGSTASPTSCRAGRCSRSTRCSPIRRCEHLGLTQRGRRTRPGARSTCCARRSRSATRRRRIRSGPPADGRAHARGAGRARVRRDEIDVLHATVRGNRHGRDGGAGATMTTITTRPIETGTEKMLAHVEDGIGWMTYNNPARLNAMSFDMQIAVPRILGAFARRSRRARDRRRAVPVTARSCRVPTSPSSRRSAPRLPRAPTTTTRSPPRGDRGG